MKAERRHELEQNSLQKFFLFDLPVYVRLHANKILLGIIAVCIIVLLVRYRLNQAEQARQMARGQLESTHYGLSQLRDLDQSMFGDVAAQAKARHDLAVQINAAVDQILDNTSDSKDAGLRAQAWIARGDLNWALANLPPLKGADTQPALALPNTARDYLDSAEAAYQQVLSQYDTEMVAKATALLGMAAIAENRGDWDAAIADYSKVSNNPAIANSFKDMARRRLAILPQVRLPVFFGHFSSTQPTTEPTTGASTLPTAATTVMSDLSTPTTSPVAPTMPAGEPATVPTTQP